MPRMDSPTQEAQAQGDKHSKTRGRCHAAPQPHGSLPYGHTISEGCISWAPCSTCRPGTTHSLGWS